MGLQIHQTRAQSQGSKWEVGGLFLFIVICIIECAPSFLDLAKHRAEYFSFTLQIQAETTFLAYMTMKALAATARSTQKLMKERPTRI